MTTSKHNCFCFYLKWFMAHHRFFARPLNSDFPGKGQRWHWLIRFLFKWWLTMQQIGVFDQSRSKVTQTCVRCKVWVRMCHIHLRQEWNTSRGSVLLQHLHAHLSLFLFSSISWKKWLVPQLLHVFVFTAQLLAASRNPGDKTEPKQARWITIKRKQTLTEWQTE